MDSSRDARLDRLLAAALEIAPAERGSWLDARCAGDEGLRRELEQLIELAAGEVDDLLEPVRAFAAETALEDRPGDLPPGERLGAWTIVGQLGRGGMGVVYLAERAEASFTQRAAIKVLSHAVGSEAAVRRFEQERRILARLAHPHIAHLVDGGIDRRGLPFLVLEHVDGEAIDAHCDRLRLPLEARLRLVIEVAHALQAAHRSLVVHRDIKPSNLLVTGDGHVKLLDFGIAKLLDPGEPEAGLTATDGRPMTPAFASPEQVRGEPIGVASDIYQLGLLLYELATGLRPQAARTSSLAELVELVCQREPAPASRAALADGPGPDESAAARAARLGSTPERLARRFRPELDAIVARALAKDPEQRYASATELAADLERFLGGRPVHARRATLGYRLAKWARRNAALVVAGALAALLTVGYAVAVTLQARAIERQRQRAEVEAVKAAEVERFVLDLFRSSDPGIALGRDVTARELLERGVDRIEGELAGQPAVQARLRSAIGEILGHLDLVAEGRALVERALAQQAAAAGEPSHELADSHRRLGVLRQLAGDDAGAVESLVRAVAIRRELTREPSGELATDLLELGNAQRRTGDLAGAEASYRESLELQNACGDTAGIAAAWSSLGSLHYSMRRYAETERDEGRALAILRGLHGERHPATAMSLLNLGMALRRQERNAEALDAFESALAVHREVYGPEHFTTVWTRVELAMALQQAGELERAEAELETVLPLLVAKLGDDDARVADVRFGFGVLRFRQGRFAEAEPHFRAALDGLAGRYGVEHYRLGPPLLWLGRSLRELGRPAEAIEAWSSAVGMMRPEADARILADLRAELERAGAAGTPVPAAR